ncbi:MAG: endonuclease, partial [Chloroflexi bacterium]|nr:endonuclease [Chloroflexota bacterium]
MCMSQDAIAASALAGLVPALEALARVNPDDLHPTTLGEGVVVLSRVSDVLKGERARWLTAFERRRGHLDDGATSMVAWATARCRMSPGAAAEMVCTARQLEDLPATARALREGEIGYPHASVIARTAGDVGAGVVREAEADLLTRARSFDVREFACLMRRFRECVDPDGALRDANRDHERTRVHLSQTLGGRFRLD